MALQRVRSNMLSNNFTLDDDQGLIVGSGNNIYIDTANNRVGINTNSPTHDFTVNGSIHATGNITAGGDITLGDSDADTITITAEIGSDILPDIDNTYDLGSASKKWAEIHATTFYGDGSQLTGIAATLNDILTNGNTSALNMDLTGGSVTATSFIGDGSGLTGITASQVTGLTTDDVAEGSNLYFTDARADTRATLRITAADIGNLNNVDETGVANGKVLKYNSTSTNWEVGDADVIADTTPQLGGNLDLNSKDITGTGNINITGDVTATNFIGDGSQLTGLASTLNDILGNGNTTALNIVSTGDITATNFIGDGSQLTGLASTLDEVTTNGATTTNSITVGGLIVNSTGAVNLPVGTTVQRPTAANGQIRFNSDLVAFEGYDGTEWGALGGGGATYSTTAPTTNLKAGDLWFDTGTTGELYVYSGTEWLSATGAGGTAFYLRNFVGDNTTTVYNVYGSGNSTVLVYMNGILVTQPDDYSYSNGSVTFVTAPALNDEINVLVYGATSGITLGLDGLSDVDLTTTPPTNNQVLKYNGTKWVPGTGEEDLSNNSIGELSNVDITTTPPTNEQVLVWDNVNSKFIPGDAAAAFTDLTGTLALTQIPDGLITPAKLQTGVVFVDEFTADGNTASFTLSQDPGSAAAIQVFVDSVPQLASNYTVSGTTLTLPVNPSNSSIVEARGYGAAVAVGTVADLSITTSKIANNVVTAAKLHTGIRTDDITEGSTNLYYTDARVSTYLGNNDYDTATNIVATITDSAPATLDTLNELAAALGDDPNFATTTANNIATKLPLAGGTLTGNLVMENTDAGSAAGPEFTLFRNSASAANADYLGQIKFDGKNDAAQTIVYAKITGKILDAADGSEDGIIEIAHKKAGSNNISARFRSDSLQLINGTNLTVAGTTDLTGDLTVDTSTLKVDTSNNRVGIGTTTPAQLLEVKGSGAKSRFTRSGSAGTAVEYYYGGNQAGGIQVQSTGLGFAGAARENDLFIKTDGNVGIGTSSPSYKFHVVDNSSLTDPESNLGVYYGFLNSNAGVDTGSAIVLGSNNNSGAAIYAQRIGGNNEHKLGIQVRNSAGSSTTHLTVMGSGNVGIGTSAPSTLLDLETPGNTVDGGYYSTMTINNTGSGTWSRIRFDRNNSAKWALSLGTDDKFKISNLDQNGGGGANDGAFVIDNTGSIGMNTQTPAAQLHINKSSTPAAGTTDTDQLVAFTVDGNSHGRIDLHTTSQNASRRSTVYRTTSSTSHGYGVSAYHMPTLDIGRVDQGNKWDGTNGDGAYTGGLYQQPRYTRKAHFSGQIIGNNTYYTIAENLNDTRFTIECFCGDASSRDYKKYAGYYTSTGYGVYGLNELLHSNGGWNSGSFDMRVSAPNGNLSIDLRFSSYYNSANIGSWICIYTGFV